MSARQANAMETTMSGGKAELLDAVVTELLRKGAIEKCHRGSGFYSRMFLVPKKGGKSRPIINLKPLNRYVRTPHFTMTTLKDVSQLIQPGDWAVCLDLRDAYFHVPVYTRHRRFLQFIWKGQTYRYTALPFGLSTSPFCFTKVTKPVVQYLRSQGVRVVFYLDDVLLLAQTRRGAQENRRRVVHLLGKLGFSLNHEKSDFVPQQSFSYLGLQWDTRSMQVRLPEDKVAEIRSLAASLQDRRIVSARSLMTFLGKVTFASYGVELARLHSRELQTALRTVYKRPRDICRTVHLHREALHSLDFWKELNPSPLPLRRSQAEIIMATDASLSGWGGSLHALSASGRWSRGQRSRHINSLELMAVENSLRSFQDRVEGRTVCVQIDNRTAVAYLGEGRGHKVGTAGPPGLPNPVVVPTASGNPDPCVRERDRQHNCGRPVQGAGDTMAPVTKDGGQDLSAVRDPPGRPVCLQGDSPVTPVHDSPAGGQSSPGSGRSQSDVGLRPGVRFPPSDACPDGGQQAQGLQGQNAAVSTLLVRRSVDASPDGTPVRHASPDPHVSEAPDQHGDQLLGGQRGGPEADCMANMRSATGLNLPSATFALLENSWRPSTRRQYQAVWKEWSKFCQNESMDPTSICVESMLGYLQYLFDKGFAWRSIGVHRSALSSILEAHKPVPVGQHPRV